ncbi:MAG: hypothetical protein K2Y23_17695 [Cyanobacteria bacterium]|nr:hypothetical protein [Cyanobacteriota bacterium]
MFSWHGGPRPGLLRLIVNGGRAHLGDPATALKLLEQPVDGGYTCAEPLMNDPWLDSLRDAPRFAALLARAEARNASALAAFNAAGGPELLGMK